MCELAEEITRAFARSRKWPLDAYPGKIKMPPDIFKPPKSLEEANKVHLVCVYSMPYVEIGLELGGDISSGRNYQMGERILWWRQGRCTCFLCQERTCGLILDLS